MRSNSSTSRSINGSSTGGYLTIDDYNLQEAPQTVIDNTILAKFPIGTNPNDIQNFSITQNKLANNSVGTNQLINLSVNNSKIIDLD